RVLGQQPAQRGPVEGVGLGAELVERRLGQRVAGHHPHAGPPLGARLGEQQGPPVGEAPPGLAAPGAGRLLRVGPQPAALHEVDDEGHRLEPEQEVLAPTPDVRQRVPGRLLGGRGRRLERGERQRLEPLEDGATEVVGQPLGVGLDLGHLGHGRLPRQSKVVAARTSASASSTAATARWCAISLVRSPPTRSRPSTKARWADSRPLAIPAAVARSVVRRTSGSAAGPGTRWARPSSTTTCHRTAPAGSSTTCSTVSRTPRSASVRRSSPASAAPAASIHSGPRYRTGAAYRRPGAGGPPCPGGAPGARAMLGP